MPAAVSYSRRAAVVRLAGGGIATALAARAPALATAKDATPVAGELSPVVQA